MPYSGASDKNLPSNVKSKPVDVRKKWVAIFNSVLIACTKKKGKNCEQQAFKIANGSIKGK